MNNLQEAIENNQKEKVMEISSLPEFALIAKKEISEGRKVKIRPIG